MNKDVSNEIIKYYNNFFKKNNLDTKDLINKLNNLKEKTSRPLTNVKYIKHEGKSGASLAIKKDNPNIIIKIREVDFYIRKSKHYDDCVKLSNGMNELLLSLLFTKPEKFKKLSDNELKTIQKNCIKINKIYFSHEITDKNEKKYYICMEQPKYGYNNKLIHLDNLLKKNIIPNLKKAITKNADNKEVLEKIYNEFDELIITIINKIYNVLKFYYKHFKFIHTDLNLNNLFIKKTKANNKYNTLKNYNIITNFDIIIADLDKSRVTLNNIDTASILDKLPDKIGRVLDLNKFNLFFKCKLDEIDTCIRVNKVDIYLVCIILIKRFCKYGNEPEVIELIDNLPKFKKFMLDNIVKSKNNFNKLIKIIYKINRFKSNLAVLELITFHCSLFKKN